ncbi:MULTISPECIES: LamG domain-containing protein [unclassified Actinoplanes]|uniref:LamG domain-containing protein n=1 Tax=unclassified Actinoplanes TaxID=2626549 RepID=UPI00030C12B0|nr:MULTISPECIES: LamG domain-containing protein [unclassified Actinoplanes]
MFAVLALAFGLADFRLVRAVFTDSTATGTNTFSAAASFPDYPTTISNDGAYFYHRLAEAQTSSATSNAADSSSNGTRTGTYDGRTDGPATWYDFEDIAGSAVADESGNGNSATLSGTTTVAGHPGSSVSFDGTASHADAARAGISVTTDFTVSAWVYLPTGADNQDRAVVSLSGSATSAFLLKFDDSDDKWEFEMAQSNIGAPTPDAAKSSGAPALDTWTHLAGVYSDASNLLTLYVNGVASATTAAHADANEWTPSGTLQLGRTWYNTAWATAYWLGRIDDVRVYQSAVTSTDILGMSTEAPTVHYRFDETGGTSVADSSGNANDGSTSGTATWNPGGWWGGALTLDGSGAAALSNSRAVATDQAFTVSAWVYLPSTAATITRAILSENGGNAAAFELKYNQAAPDRWELAMWDNDNSASNAAGAKSAAVATKDAWQMITGVYDDAADLLRLYVNGVQSGTTARTDAVEWAITNRLQIGRSRNYGAWANPFSGSIDDVRTYQAALTPNQISQLYKYGRTIPTGMTAGGSGALQGPLGGQAGNTAVAFNGSGSGFNPISFTNPTTFTIECWFKGSDNRGGQILAFNADQTSFFPTYTTDRMVYIDSAQRLVFGVNKAGTIVTAAYAGSAATWKNWHHVAATMSPANGIRLYLDGALVASDATGTAGGNYTGFWRWGGGHLTGWPNRPGHDYFVGMIDEVAYYQTELTALQVSRDFNANR